MAKIINIYVVFLPLFIGSQSGFSHGENKPGPHQGHIRMPGAYHTELVISGATGEFKVYLLDMEFKRPTTKLSTVSAELKQGDKLVAAKCRANDDFFSCQLPTGARLENGTLGIKTKRLGAVGAEAIYNLPLSFADVAH